MIFRREPIHKRLAREGRLEAEPSPVSEAAPAPEPEPEPGSRSGLTGVDGVPRPRRWDAVAPAQAPGLTGNEVHFVALPNGDLVVDENQPENTLAPLAEAIEQTLRPPYRAEAIRRDGESWGVAARRIEVAVFEADGDELEVVANDDGRTLVVDGEQAFGGVPELQRIGERQGITYVVRARRLEGTFWEVEAHPL
ncbi:MAG TPA: hypothetical protein VMG74_04365 [Gaiellaceae bacterium]|nr:hypothetical protein [Gaiellaceae bacterium]